VGARERARERMLMFDRFGVDSTWKSSGREDGIDQMGAAGACRIQKNPVQHGDPSRRGKDVACTILQHDLKSRSVSRRTFLQVQSSRSSRMFPAASADTILLA
jgi:hypothetical protein